MASIIAPNTSKTAIKWLTVLSIAGLALGVAIGMLVARWEPAGSNIALAAADAVVRAWTNAFRILVAPLVVAQLYLAVSAERSPGVSAGRLGLAIPLTFGGLLAITALLTILLMQPVLQLAWVRDVALPPPSTSLNLVPATSGGSAWVDALIPPNLFAAATLDNILPLMLFALAFAVAMRSADSEARETILRIMRGISHASFALVEWLFRLTPIVMLGIGFRSAMNSGFAVGEAILVYASLEIVFSIAATVLLYAVVAALATFSIGRFARAIWPAQLTAMATRSSLATLPMLMAAAANLGLHKETAGAVLPIAGATLKLSQAVTHPIKLLFLAAILGIHITPERLLVFSITIMLLSASVPGVPSVTSGNRSLPAFIAAGVPVEYVVVLGVATSLSDVFQTVHNSTGYLSAASLVDRFGVRSRPTAMIEAPPDPIQETSPGTT